MVSHHWTSSIAAVFNGVIFLSMPILTALAIRRWTRRWRQELPRWRSTLGLASMVVTLLSWFGLAFLALSVTIMLSAVVTKLPLHRPTREADMVHSSRARPRRCGRAYSLTPRRRRCGACAM